MIDTAAAKQLLQSNDVDELQKAAKEWKQYIDGSRACVNYDDNADVTAVANANAEFDAYKPQIMKLILLIHSKLVQLIPRSEEKQLANSFYEMGNIWMLLGDIPKAIGQFNHSLQWDENNITTLLAISEAYGITNNFQNAIDSITQAIELQTTNSTAAPIIGTSYIKLAEIYEHTAEFTKAVDTLQKAADLLAQNAPPGDDNNDETDNKSNTKNPYYETKSSIYSLMGSIQSKIGNYKDAVTSLTTAVQTMSLCYGSDHPKTQEAEYLLEMALSLN